MSRAAQPPGTQAERLDRVRDAAKRFGKGCGVLVPDGAGAADKQAQGWTFVAVGSDSTLLAAAVTAELARARDSRTTSDNRHRRDQS